MNTFKQATLCLYCSALVEEENEKYCSVECAGLHYEDFEENEAWKDDLLERDLQILDHVQDMLA